MSKTIYTAEIRSGAGASFFKKNIILLIVECVIGFVCFFIPVIGWIISIVCFILAFSNLITWIVGAKTVSSMFFAVTETGIRTRVAMQDTEITFDQITKIYVRDQTLVVETTLPEKKGSSKNKIIENPFLVDPKGFIKAYEAQKAKASDSASHSAS